MNDIASVHNASASQVALNWLIEKGTLPIPGAKSAKQAAGNASAMTWRLADDEFYSLNEATNRYV